MNTKILSFFILTALSGFVNADSASQLNSNHGAWEDSTISRTGEAETLIGTKYQMLTLKIDNDSLLLRDSDGLYTSGNELQLFVGEKSALARTGYHYTFGQDLYTPNDIKRRASQLTTSDRPYAGWLYLGLGWSKTEVKGNSLRLDALVGCMGPCAGGEKTQNQLHKILRQPLPVAWETQVRQRWGVAMLADWSPGSLLPWSNLVLNPNIKLQLGNLHSYLELGSTLKIGAANFMDDHDTKYLYVSPSVRRVWSNHAITGGRINPNLGIKEFVPQIELGLAYYGTQWGLNLALVRRWNEIVEMSGSEGAQNFARIKIQYKY